MNLSLQKFAIFLILTSLYSPSFGVRGGRKKLRKLRQTPDGSGYEANPLPRERWLEQGPSAGQPERNPEDPRGQNWYLGGQPSNGNGGNGHRGYGPPPVGGISVVNNGEDYYARAYFPPCPVGSNCGNMKPCMVHYNRFLSCLCSGYQVRWGQVVHQPNPNMHCPPTWEIRPCQTPPRCRGPGPGTGTETDPTRIGTGTTGSTCRPQDCVVDCEQLSDCSATCGPTGVRTRTCKVVSESKFGGRPCPPLKQTFSCPTQPNCPEDCLLDFGSWSDCGCDSEQSRVAVIRQPARYGGQPCPDSLSETRSCTPPRECYGEAPVDCKVSCLPWSPCSVTCGNSGKQTRPCEIQQWPANGGRPCPGLYQVQSCSGARPCPHECVVDYGPWSTCSCFGHRSRKGVVTQEPVDGGTPCPPLLITESCQQPENCPKLDCQFYCDDYTACSVSCGEGGTQSTTCTMTAPPQNGGRPCPPAISRRACPFNPPCPVDCEYSWSGWSECSCDGYRHRTMTITRPPVGSGLPCPDYDATETCRPPPYCQVVDCIVDCKTGPCSATCGSDGIQLVTCRVTQEPSDGGTPCPPLRQTLSCAADRPCPVDCSLEWSPWSTCSCLGQQSRRGWILQQPAFGGISCPPQEQDRVCTPPPFCEPIDCQVECDEMGPCSASCGANRIQRVRCHVIQEASGTGRPCPTLDKTVSCPDVQCPVDCQVDYGDWTDCQAIGVRYRLGIMVQPSVSTGLPCPPLTISEPCLPPFTFRDLDCKASCDAFSPCSASCGHGFESRMCTILTPAKPGGAPCPPTSRPCFAGECPVDCIVDWSDFSECNCGGQQTRYGEVVQEPHNGGRPCSPLLVSSQRCRPPPNCDVTIRDCVTQCEDMSPCSASCGEGFQTQRCTVTQKEETGGRPCPPLERRFKCHGPPCPVDCEVQFGPWSSCSCFGSQSQRGIVIRNPEFGGRPCPELLNSRPCKAPEDCKTCSTNCTNGRSPDGGSCCQSPEPGPPCTCNECPCYPKVDCDCPMCPYCRQDCKQHYTRASRCDCSGYQRRYGLVDQPAQYGGRGCGQTVQRWPCRPSLSCSPYYDRTNHSADGYGSGIPIGSYGAGPPANPYG